MEPIVTDRAPTPAGHYSQAMVHGGFVFVAGQLPIDPAAPARPPGTVAEQTEQALRNVAAILEAAGSGLNHVVQMTIYVSDMALWPEVNTVYARMLGEHRPARAVVPTQEFRKGYQVEIQAIAAAD
jgi:2-iminobutanoate/2-iminopropanoate deaminase